MYTNGGGTKVILKDFANLKVRKNFPNFENTTFLYHPDLTVGVKAVFKLSLSVNISL